jgi:biotin-(acetyl-CoA carboxylase) ligase
MLFYRILVCFMFKTLFNTICIIERRTVGGKFVSAFRDLSHQTPSTKLVDDMSDRSDQSPTMNSIELLWFDEVSSTMDKAREVIQNDTASFAAFAVVSDTQTNGRGTRGRSWKYGAGNLFMTIGLHRMKLPIPFQYLPLRVGTLIGSALHPYITSHSSTMKLKWPNDILINAHKVCGILIEMEDDYFLIGIGCNVWTIPEVSPDGPDGGRSPTALVDHSSIISDMYQRQESCDANQQCSLPPPHRQIAVDIATKFSQWIADSNGDSPQQVIDDFSVNMDFTEQVLRDKMNLPTGRVQPLRLNSDGTLKARYVHDGSEVDLVADYLY